MSSHEPADGQGFSDQSLTVYPDCSRCYTAVLTLIHGMAMYVLMLHVNQDLIESALTLSLSLAVALSWWVQLTEDSLRSSEQAVVALRWEEHHWQLMTCRDGWQPGKLRGTQLLNPWLLVLNFSIRGRRQQVVIARDALDPDGYRRLRVLLKWGTNQMLAA